jgi:putative methyltransferase (TIGR04325 family)
MQLKDFIPPIVVKLAKRYKTSPKLYNSYEDALTLCKSGYEENNLVNVVYEKTRLYRDSLLAQHPFVSEITSLRTLIGLSLSCRGNELNVIDFGGACGAHYFLSKIVFGEKIKLRWHVVETTKMVSKAIGLQDGELKFFDSLSKAKSAFDRVDLVFTSGALQYVPRPYELLDQLANCTASNIFITRVGLSTMPKELIVIQKSNLSEHGPGLMPKGMLDGVVQFPVTFTRKDRFEEILKRNYSIDILLNEDKGVYRAANNSIDMYGYFGSLRKAHNLAVNTDAALF